MSRIDETNEQTSLDEAIELINAAEADFLVRAALAGDERALRLVNAICDLGSDQGKSEVKDEPDLLLEDDEFFPSRDYRRKQGGAT